MVFGLPTPGEPNWDVKLDASIEAVKTTADAAEAEIAGRLSESSLTASYARRFTPEAFGAVGDGVADDTDAVRDCFEAAAAELRAGLTATIWHPGATVALAGVYNLATLAAPIDVMCNVESNRGGFIVPAAYAGVAVRVGHTTSGSYLQAADINLPDVVKPSGTAVVAGSVGVRTQNIGDSMIRLGRVCYFETAVNCSGDGQGTAYNRIHLGWVSYSKVSLSLKPHTASGWCNHNTFVGGSVQQSPSYDGGDGAGTGIRRAGWRHVELDGSAGNYVNGNTFLGTSFEGDCSEYWLYAKSAADNHFIGTRHEQGTAGVAVTVSGDTLTKAAHGLAVGDMVTFAATSTPTGMVLAAPYYVVSVPTVDTFKVSQKKAGTAITFSTDGSGVTYFRPPRAYFDLSGTILGNITVEKSMSQQGIMEVIKSTGGGSNLIYERPGFHLRDSFVPEDIPVYRARNSSSASGISRALFATYAQGVNPVENPRGWSAALSDRGLLFGASDAETVCVSAGSSGNLTARRAADSVAYDVPTWRRAQSATTLASGTIYTAGTRTSGTIALTGIAVGDYVVWSNASGGAIPRGLVISVRVSAADTITYDIDNNTAADITLPSDVSLYVAAARRFF